MNKPLGIKSYGHIPHLPGSRITPSDHKCSDGQKRIACEKVRDKHDKVIVQEKLDGSNVGIARIGDRIYPLTRSGYIADTSKYEQHHRFHTWVMKQQKRFLDVLDEGERLCGEWLMQAHGTRYDLPHEPFVVFDLMVGDKRLPYDELKERLEGKFTLPRLISYGNVFSIEQALKAIEVSGHGAIDLVEGVVWRVERNELVDKRLGGNRKWKVDFLVKYVRSDKRDGIYLSEISGNEPVWNLYKEIKWVLEFVNTSEQSALVGCESLVEFKLGGRNEGSVSSKDSFSKG